MKMRMLTIFFSLGVGLLPAQLPFPPAALPTARQPLLPTGTKLNWKANDELSHVYFTLHLRPLFPLLHRPLDLFNFHLKSVTEVPRPPYYLAKAYPYNLLTTGTSLSLIDRLPEGFYGAALSATNIYDLRSRPGEETHFILAERPSSPGSLPIVTTDQLALALGHLRVYSTLDAKTWTKRPDLKAVILIPADELRDYPVQLFRVTPK